MSILALLVILLLPAALVYALLEGITRRFEDRPQTISYRQLRQELEWRAFQGIQPEDPEYFDQLLFDLSIAEKGLTRDAYAHQVRH